MKDFTKYYINLSNCSEVQQEHIFSLLPKPRTQYLLEMDDDCYFLCYKYNAPYGFEWIVCVDSFTNGKTKLLYPEFIKLFEEPTKLPSELLKEYFENTPREQVLKDWENTAHLDVNSPKVSELFEGGEVGKTELSFETEYQLEEFRKVQPEYFDENGKCYTGNHLGSFIMEQMLSLINQLETELNSNQ